MSTYELAELNYTIERVDLKIAGGKQDQYATTFGGFNLIEFHKDRVVVNPLRIEHDILNDLEAHCLLCYTGHVRPDLGLVDGLVNSYRTGQPEALKAMKLQHELVYEMKEALVTGHIEQLGEMFDRAYAQKKRAVPDVAKGTPADLLYESGEKARGVGKSRCRRGRRRVSAVVLRDRASTRGPAGTGALGDNLPILRSTAGGCRCGGVRRGEDAAVLAGGLGTRLRQTIRTAQRSWHPWRDGRSSLTGWISWRPPASRRLCLCTGYLGERRLTFGERYGDLELCYSRESEPLGTAGALRLALPVLDGDPVLVLNGDCTVKLSCATCALALGDARGAARSLLVDLGRGHVAGYGSGGVDANDAIRSFCEKGGRPSPGWINAGIYLLSRPLSTSIPAARRGVDRTGFFQPGWEGHCERTAPGRRLSISDPEVLRAGGGFFAHRGPATAARPSKGVRSHVVLDG